MRGEHFLLRDCVIRLMEECLKTYLRVTIYRKSGWEKQNSFPECNLHKLDENLFERLVYDRKTEGYKTANELARLIILTYHPDIKGGKDDILAIIFNMNLLWEKFIFWSLRKSVNKGYQRLK